jgi:hypothetical protein
MFTVFRLLSCVILVLLMPLHALAAPTAGEQRPPSPTSASSAAVPAVLSPNASDTRTLPPDLLSLDSLAKIGQLLSGIGILVTAITALLTLALISIKQQRAAWLESFRLLYQEFWRDDDVTLVRHAIVTEAQYAAILPILQKRNATPETNTLTDEENLTIERIDRFCSTMVRIKSLGQTSKGERQHQLWKNVYGDFWYGKIRRRLELLLYIDTHWAGLFDNLPIETDRQAVAK